MKLPCSVVRDLLPVYAENLTEPETRELIDRHLQECGECRTKAEAMERGEECHVDATQPLKSLKKQIRIRRWRTAAIAALTVLVVLVTLVFRAGSMQLLEWEDGLATVRGIINHPDSSVYANWPVTVFGPGDAEIPLHEYRGEALVLQLDSRMTGTQTETIVGEDGSETVYLQGWGRHSHSLRQSNEEYNEMVLYPVPDRVMYGFGNEQVLLWGEPGTGGAQVLPRLALAAYLLIEAVLLALTALAWRLAKATRFNALLRQITFVPLCCLLAQLLLKGTKTATFFLTADVLYILFTAAALYALVTLGWQAWQQREAI